MIALNVEIEHFIKHQLADDVRDVDMKCIYQVDQEKEHCVAIVAGKWLSKIKASEVVGDVGLDIHRPSS
jgi:hypothetical protein